MIHAPFLLFYLTFISLVTLAAILEKP